MIKPSGPLMVEHRLIEKMIVLLKKEVTRIKESNSLNTHFIDSAVDFFKIYADKTHHGKEEDILFKAMEKKLMDEDLRSMMKSLIQDHVTARSAVTALIDCKNRYIAFDKNALKEAIDILNSLIALYPPHIQKEDIQFFPKAMKLFTEEEQNAMTQEFYDFDRTMIHVKYRLVVDSLLR